MRKVLFYETTKGIKPVKEFLDSMSDKQAKKIVWVLRLIRDLDFIPKEYLKKLLNTAEF